ncbi:helix-turn-helix domain-containing protein [Haloglycomyces albus]|uniref:helix-turn-helix domain-containing protein n=1 Tax=Haloglycomyces albus TaxID=526067 RepID=UPI0012EB1111
MAHDVANSYSKASIPRKRLKQTNRPVSPRPPQRGEQDVIQPRWYSIPQSAVALEFSVSKVKRLIRAGRLKSVKDGRNVRILPEWIDQYINSVVELEEKDVSRGTESC